MPPIPPPAPTKLKPIVPMKPIIIPATCIPEISNLKKYIATSRVNKGERALRIPVSELSSFVSANAKRTAGIKLPTSPVKKINLYFSLLTCLICLTANGRKNKKANEILMVPTCEGVNTSSPFFIKMNELPQINERIKRISQTSALSDFADFAVFEICFNLFNKEIENSLQ